MFKPWKKTWFQTIAAFLGKGALKGPLLVKLALEATCLLEQCDLHVDMWVCDGAPWNRNMWAEVGLSNPFSQRKTKQEGMNMIANKGRTSFQHPCDEDRRIYMCSDFPHLIKSLKSRIFPNEKGLVKDLVTPDGIVKFSHWVALYEADNVRGKPIQRCHKLSRDHLYLPNYQKMNVGMAFGFFSKTVADAMEAYQEEGYPNLEDSAPTIAFIRRINTLIDAMNANTPWNSIRPGESVTYEADACESKDEDTVHKFETKKCARKVINEFLDSLVEMSEMPVPQHAKLAHQTQYGLYVTLCSALEVADYLINCCKA
ncbi:uncharacterized protein LOC116160393 [Photinus pyralis]|uniref:uncharacterized protein LOC116159612 n=1 Tax=Photinus pyralis TaxID=7054 RepID=UPI0012671E45|nr:uncharacterized protein LOC116159612 [Photinus pyralis]XP_031328496.1 uncharacterized protein LOC116159612 [Photinus pyralis]XP_031329437.1 uncharacterized protein LOC116160393 [Photinus pyralis]